MDGGRVFLIFKGVNLLFLFRFPRRTRGNHGNKKERYKKEKKYASLNLSKGETLIQ